MDAERLAHLLAVFRVTLLILVSNAPLGFLIKHLNPLAFYTLLYRLLKRLLPSRVYNRTMSSMFLSQQPASSSSAVDSSLPRAHLTLSLRWMFYVVEADPFSV
jgi:hypothetical protein